MDETVTINKSEFDALKQQVSILTKIAPKDKIDKFTPKGDQKKKVKIRTYSEDPSKEPSVVIGWKLIKDIVRPGSKEGIYEDQVMEVYLDEDIDPSTKQGYVMQIGRLNKQLETTTDDKEKQKINEKIEELNRKTSSTQKTVTMSYEIFSKSLDKEEVEIIDEISDFDPISKGRTPKFYILEFKGKEYKIGAPFVN